MTTMRIDIKRKINCRGTLGRNTREGMSGFREKNRMTRDIETSAINRYIGREKLLLIIYLYY